jgi:hypothetical protein
MDIYRGANVHRGLPQIPRDYAVDINIHRSSRLRFLPSTSLCCTKFLCDYSDPAKAASSTHHGCADLVTTDLSFSLASRTSPPYLILRCA